MILTFAGEPLLLEDPEGKVRRFLRRHIDPAQNSLFGDQTSGMASQRQNPITPGTKQVTIPIFNYPERPRLRLNELWIPTGANRWGCGLFCCTGTTLNAIANTLNHQWSEEPLRFDARPGELVINDESGAAGSSGPWYSLTAYSEGQTVASAGNIYRCVSSGVSAPLTESGGPSGTGSGISDGSVVWDYVSAAGGFVRMLMHLLPPRKITPDDATENSSEDLWLLPLVDDRYLWQFANMDPSTGFVESTLTTWSKLIDWCQGCLRGTTESGGWFGAPQTVECDYDPVPAVYLTPHPELLRFYDSTAMLIDAVAANLGCRVVFDPATLIETGRVRLQSPKEAESIHGSNITEFVNNPRSGQEGESVPQVTAGAENASINTLIGAVTPISVIVVFRDPTLTEFSNRLTRNAMDVLVGPDQDQQITQFKAGVYRLFHETLYCPPGDPLTSDFTDEEEEQYQEARDLTNRIAQDFYSWLTHRHDITLPGIKLWELTGFDDGVLYSVGRHDADGNYQCSTRVWSPPHDFGVCTLTHGTSDSGGAWYQVVSHPCLSTGRDGSVWCIALPFQDADGNDHWSAETASIALDGSTYVDANSKVTTNGVELPLVEVQFNAPELVGTSNVASYVGAVFPRQVIQATGGGSAIVRPPCANVNLSGEVTEVGSSFVKIQISGGIIVTCSKALTSETWAVGNTAIAWFVSNGSTGGYIAANTTC